MFRLVVRTTEIAIIAKVTERTPIKGVNRLMKHNAAVEARR
jgi:hypothetical protein